MTVKRMSTKPANMSPPALSHEGENGLTASPEDGRSTRTGSLSPVLAAKQYGEHLTSYEKAEIDGYAEIFYVGQKCRSKVNAPTSGLNDGYDNSNGEYTIVAGDHIAYRYEIVCVLGTGAFGQVVKAVDHAGGGEVAVKLIRNKRRVAQQAKTEVSILDHVNKKDPLGRYSVVRMLDSFTFRSHICIVYELLGMNLYDHMEKTDFYPMSLTTVRKVATRMLVALTFLWKENIIHCDLKPENVLYQDDPADAVVKVVDLGSACYDSRSAHTYIQSRFYRAPEIILGYPYGRPIDLWSFGCILCELATGYPLFPGENEKDQLACVMEFCGVPPAELVAKCKKKDVYFDAEQEPKISPNSKGRVRRPGAKTIATFLGLSEDDPFVSFVEQFLRWDPDERVPPRQAMRHPWIAEEFDFAPAAASGSVADPPPAAQPVESGVAATTCSAPAAAAAAAVAAAEAVPPPSGSTAAAGAAEPCKSAADSSGGEAGQSLLSVASSPKRRRPAMLTFERKDSAGGGDGDGSPLSNGRSMIASNHLSSTTLRAPSPTRGGNSGAPSPPAGGVASRRAAVPTFGPATAPAPAPAPASRSAGGTAVVRRRSTRPVAREPLHLPDSHPSEFQARLRAFQTNTAGEEQRRAGAPSPWPQHSARAKTASLEMNHSAGTGADGAAGGRRRSEALPRLANIFAVQAPSAPIPGASRRQSGAGAVGAGGSSTESPARRPNSIARRQANRRRGTQISAIPENTASGSSLPRI